MADETQSDRLDRPWWFPPDFAIDEDQIALEAETEAEIQARPPAREFRDLGTPG